MLGHGRGGVGAQGAQHAPTAPLDCRQAAQRVVSRAEPLERSKPPRLSSARRAAAPCHASRREVRIFPTLSRVARRPREGGGGKGAAQSKTVGAGARGHTAGCFSRACRPPRRAPRAARPASRCPAHRALVLCRERGLGARARAAARRHTRAFEACQPTSQPPARARLRSALKAPPARLLSRPDFRSAPPTHTARRMQSFEARVAAPRGQFLPRRPGGGKARAHLLPAAA